MYLPDLSLCRYMMRGMEGHVPPDLSNGNPDGWTGHEEGQAGSHLQQQEQPTYNQEAPAEAGSGLLQGGNGRAGHTFDPDGHTSSQYILYAVICHKGDITGGHYVAYVRCAGAWFLCDDAWITLVDEEEVAQAQAYMLFFCSEAFYDNAALGLHGPPDMM